MLKNAWLRLAKEDPDLLHSIFFIASAPGGFTSTKVSALTTDAQQRATSIVECLKGIAESISDRTSDAAIGIVARLVMLTVSRSVHIGDFRLR